MRWRNSSAHRGLLAVLLHWLVVLAVIGLFGLGLWMTALDYYHPWYRRGPDLHRSIGVLLFAVILLRLAWRLLSPTPRPLPSHRPWEIGGAHAAHALLYLLPLATTVSGYLLSTADGRGVFVFDWFEVPALYTRLEQQEEVMGDLHAALAWGLIAIAALHALAALKHHFIDRDTTLTRMLGSHEKEEQARCTRP